MTEWREAVLFMSALLLAAPGTGQATFPGGNGRIAFASSQTASPDDLALFTIEPDGTGKTQLTHPSDGIDTGPNWSPDGRRIAFTHSAGNYEAPIIDLYVVNADGTGLTQVTSGPGNDVDVAWSPAGTRLAFVRAPPCFPSPGFPCPEWDIWTINLDGTDLRQVTDHNGLDEVGLDWSSDGSKLVFGGRGDIWTITPAGTDATRVPTDGHSNSSPSWSPDGTKIAFGGFRDEPNLSSCFPSCNSEIYVIDADSTNVTRVTSDPAYDQEPAWSPDGRKLVFEHVVCNTSTFTCDDRNLYAINRDGTGLTQLTTGAASEYGPDWQPLLGRRREDFQNAAKFCKAQRDFLGESAFRQQYGGGANAYGKCVSGTGA